MNAEITVGTQPLKPQGAEQLRNLQTELLTAQKTAPEREKFSQLKGRVTAIVGDTSFIPPFVITTSGIHTFSLEDRERLMEQITDADPADTSFWQRADDIIQNALVQAEVKEGEERRDLARLKEKKAEVGKHLLPDVKEEMERKAKEIISHDQFEQFGDALVGAIEQMPQYQVAGAYLHHARDISRELRTLLATLLDERYPGDNVMENIRNLTKQLLKSSNPLPSGKQLKAEDLLSKEYVETLSVVSGELIRLPQVRPKKWVRFRETLNAALEKALSPERAIDIIYKAEAKGLLAEDRSKPNMEESGIEKIRGTLDQMKEVYTLLSIRNAIEEDGNLTPNAQAYLTYTAYEYAYLRDKCSATFAYEASQDNEILLQELGAVIKNLKGELGAIPKETSGASIAQKRLSKLIIGLLAATVISQIPPETYPMAAQQIVSIVQQAGETVKSAVKVPPPKLDKNVIEQLSRPKPTKNAPSIARSTPQPSETQPQVNHPLPDRHYEGKQITTDSMHWSRYEGRGTGTHSPEGSVSPEQFLRQSSEIAWEVSGLEADADYFINRFASQYSPQADQFEEQPLMADLVNWHTVPTPDQIGNSSQIQLFAKRSDIGKYITVPAPWYKHIESASIEIVESNSTNIVRTIPVTLVGTTPNGELILNPNLPEGYLQVPKGQEILIKVGLGGMFDRQLDTSFIHFDKDAKFPDRTVFPPDLLQKIDALNQNPNLSDVEKLQEVKQWFQQKFMYSLDPLYFQYYQRGNPTHEQFYRRLFGTGSLDEDPNYIDDPRYIRKGFCESVNTAFAIAARELDLREGQIVMAQGFVHSGLFAGPNTESITYGQLHAWSAYISDDGHYTNLDATPSNIDPFTQQVLQNARTNSSVSKDKSQSQGFSAEGQVPSEPNPKDKYSERNTVITSFDNLVPIPERIEQALVIEQPLNSWKLILPSQINIENHVIYADSTNPFIQDLSLKFDKEANQWKSNFPQNAQSVDLKGGFTNDYLLKDAHSRHVDPEDLAAEIVGIVKLDGNAIMLPHRGEISPRSISVTRITKEKDGSVKREPLPLARLVDDSVLTDYYMLVIDKAPFELDGSTVEVRYKTIDYPANQHEYAVTATQQQAKEFFAPILPKEWLGPELSQVIDILDQADTISKLSKINLPYVDFSKNDLLQYMLKNEFTYKADSAQVDGIKVNMLLDYINQNYKLTWNPEWSRFYQGNGNTQEFWKRVTTYKRVDPEIATTLLIAAARELKSQQGDFNIPMAAEITYRDFAVSGPMRFFGRYFPDYPDEAGLLTQSERNLNPVLLENFNPDPSKKLSFGIWSGYGFADAFRMNFDPLSADLASRTMQNIYDPEVLDSKEHLNDQLFVKGHTLTPEDRFKLSVEEAIQLRFLNWINNDPWWLVETELGVIVGLYVMYRVMHRIDWWKDFSASEFKQVLDKASVEIGIKADHPIHKYLNDFYDQVLKPSAQEKHIPVITAFRKAGRMDRFLRTEQVENPDLMRFRTSPIAGKENLDKTGFQGRFYKWLYTSGEHEPVRDIATGKRQGYDAETQRIARKMLHAIYSERYIPQVLHDRLTFLANCADNMLAEIPGFPGMRYKARRSKSPVFIALISETKTNPPPKNKIDHHPEWECIR